MTTALSLELSGNLVQIDAGSRHEGVRSDRIPAMPWIEGYVLSSLLDQYEIFHLGVVNADARYMVSRVHSPYTHFMATLSGGAVLWHEGERHLLTAGTACLLPKGSSYVDHALEGESWRFCYLCYLSRKADQGFRGLQRPIVGEYDAIPLCRTIETLCHECALHSDADCQRQLLGLANHFVLRFVSKHQPDDRLARLWERVAASPAEDWSLDRLAREAHCHREHLRRLCRRYLGRSPAQQVAFIRMQRGATLLRNTPWTLQNIAAEVGYIDAFSFSTAFKRWFKVCPTKYREAE